MGSLSRRLLFSASVVLFVFLGAAGWVLDRAFTTSAQAAAHERLQGHVYTLLAAAQMGPESQLQVPSELPEARFSAPGSGLYARIVGGGNEPVWRSPSLLTSPVPFESHTPVGQVRFRRVDNRDGPGFLILSHGIAWEGESGRQVFTVQVAEDLSVLQTQVAAFRRTLWGWLGALAVALLAVQLVILRWGLRPLHRVAADLGRIKAGESSHLAGDYPRELSVLTESINAFIESERTQRDRYRNTLADLAHSLKTPLAVIQSTLDEREWTPASKQALRQQAERIDQIVVYQLQRAATSGRSTLGSGVPVRPAAERVVATLNKVYKDKGLGCAIEIDPNARFPGDEGDLLELFGNLLDNAYKWAVREVAIRVTERPVQLIMVVEDDGPGIPPARRHALLHRGVRADSGTEGQGIGLSVAHDIVLAYGGHLELHTSSALGGASVRVVLPVA